MEDVLSGRVAIVTGRCERHGPRHRACGSSTRARRVVVGDLNDERAGSGSSRRRRRRPLALHPDRRGRRGRRRRARRLGGRALRPPRRHVQQRRRRRRLRADHRDRASTTGTTRSPSLTRSVFLGIKHAARVMIDAGRGRLDHQHRLDRRAERRGGSAGLLGGQGGGGQPDPQRPRSSWRRTGSGSTPSAPGLIYTPLMHVGRNEERLREQIAALQPWPDARAAPPHRRRGAVAGLRRQRVRHRGGHRVDGGLLAAGPRLVGMTDPHGAFQRYTGFADGTTGRPPEKRRLAPRDGA